MSIFRVLLLPFSLLFGAVVCIRNTLYDYKLLKIHKVDLPVLSVGNISVGGSGKTPYILKLIELLKSHGKNPAVIYRGYKRTSTASVAKVDLETDSSSFFGDEASLVAFKTKVPVYIGSDRVIVANKIVRDEQVDVILLDDGYQHRRLHRDLDIAVLDATDKKSAYQLMPVGRAREPLSSLQRAGIVALHKINLPHESISLRSDIQSSILFRGVVKMSDWVQLNYNFVDLPLETTTLVCGVAKPEQVEQTLKSKYSKLNFTTKAFADHHHFSSNDIPNGIVVVTEKDAIKIKDLRVDLTKIFVMVNDLDWNLKYEELASKLFTHN